MRMRATVQHLTVAFLLVVAGCGGRAEQARLLGGLASVRPSAAAAALPEVKVACADGACPSSVGVLYHAGDGAPQRCTAALVGSDRVLTAGHCLPRGRRAEGDSCDAVFVAFPASGRFPGELRRCARVLGATQVDDPATLTPDFAIVSLDRPTARPAFALDPAPLAPGTVVTVVASTPDPQDATVHALRSRRCLVDGADAPASVLGPRAHAVSWLGLCPIRPGNSGAPVLDRTGRVRGIVHGGSPPFFAHAVVTPAASVRGR